MAITYHTEKEGFEYGKKRLTSAWLKKVIEAEGGTLGDISVVFCSDQYVLQTNRQFLDHDYFTDIITFDYCLEKGKKRLISGDLIISVDNVRENGETFKTGFENELKRVIVHGVLHLLGYGDKQEEEKAVMRSKEDEYLALLVSMSEK